MKLQRLTFLALAALWLACPQPALGPEPVPEKPVPETPAPRIVQLACAPPSGAVPLTTRCAFTVEAAEGQSVRCTLRALGPSAAEQVLEPCAGAGETSLALTLPGDYLIELRAVDAAGQSTSVSVPVQVQPPQNRAPEISSFSATPASGVVPFEALFAWSISDADGDALGCTLDVGADGTVEETLPNCSSADTRRRAFAAAGSFPVELMVADGRGGIARRSVTVTARVSVGDVRLARVEWGQSVVAAAPRLVAGKAALLRLHVLGSKAGIAGVRVKAEGFANGASLGTVSLTGPASPPLAEAPADLAQQYRGEVPAAWVAPGLSVRVSVDPDDVLAETDETNNAATVTPTVGAGTVLPITIVPVAQGGTTGQAPNLRQLMLQLWPLKDLDLRTRAPYTFAGTIGANDPSGWSRLLDAIATVRRTDGSRRYYYGAVRANYRAGIAGIGFIGTPASVGRDDSDTTAAHEIGHNMGRPHAPCGGAASPDPRYPYPGARIGSYGWDPVRSRLVSPSNNFDIMGYCPPEWISDYNYRLVQTQLEQSPPVALVPGAPALHLLVHGRLEASGALELAPLHRVLAAASEPEAQEASLTLRLRTADRVLEVPLALVPVEDGTPGELQFVSLVPDPGALEGLELLREGRVLLERRALPTASAPRVSWSEASGRGALRWDDGRYREALLAHLGSDERTTLAVSLVGGEATLALDGLAGGGVLEVSLSDGLNPLRLELAR